MSSRTHSWRLRPFRAGDETPLVHLFNEVFDRKIDQAYWRWKLKTLPSPVENVGVAADREDRPVCQLAGIPLRFRTPAGERWAMIAVDAMTDPRYRRQGVFKRVGRSLFEAWREAGIPLALGLPNEQYSRATLGWESLFPLRWRVRPLRPVAMLARRLGVPTAAGRSLDRLWSLAWTVPGTPRGLEVAELREATADFDRLWEACGAATAFSVVRNRAWVHWRYFAAPHRRYTVLLARREGPSGFAAYSFAPGATARRAVIAEVFALPGDRATQRALLAEIARRTGEEGAETLAALSVPGTCFDRVLRRSGFVFTPGAFDVTCVRFDPELSLSTLQRRLEWTIAGGDFDIV